VLRRGDRQPAALIAVADLAAPRPALRRPTSRDTSTSRSDLPQRLGLSGGLLPLFVDLGDG